MSVKVVLVICLVQQIFGSPFISPEHDGSIQLAKEEKPGLGGNKAAQNKQKELEEKAGIKSGIKEHHIGQDLTCDATRQVGSHTDKYEDCPDQCPFFASNRQDTAHCTFVCVPANECKKWNPNKPIADMVKKSKTCRGPMVQFCAEPVLDGTDSCQRCQSGFAVHVDDGQCYFQYWTILAILGAIVLVVVIVVLVWFVDFCCRETINQDAVDRACEFRSRSKNLAAKNAEGIRATYPITTNLCRQSDVAGPGMLLHFNFQAFLIFWPLVIAVTWTILACFHNELFILGTRKFGTARHNCILVAWGYETQQRLMWTKVLFIAIVYVFSFVSFMLFGVRQHRIYEEMDAEEKTMKDFAAELTGLPKIRGDQNVEDMIKQAVEGFTDATIVGVSVAWNYADKEEEIMQAVKDDQTEQEKAMGKYEQPPTASECEPPESFGSLKKWVYNCEKAILGPAPEEEYEDVTDMLKGLESSESAFVVFKTELDKKDAVEKAQNGGLKLKLDGGQECPLQLEDLECEPGTVNWQNYGDTEPSAMMKRFLYGFFVYYVPALSLWFFLFYVPYAISLYNFNYDNGAELPGFYGLVFTMIVVGGNATMYVICDMICDVIGFKYKDTKQTVYMLFYLCACMINVLLDMVVTYYVALKVMIGLDFRTYDGTRIADIDVFTEQFETYAMQRSLAENSYRYAWPSTFLVPFLLEPFITVLIPFQIGKLIIRTHREVTGSCAEAYIAAFDFDLGRYADILLNVFLGLIILYFPGGYTWSLFYGMFVSHIVIYAFDHWRVLSAIPSIKIVSRAVDWWAQVVLGACCGMILSVGVFKMNCESYAGYCLKTVGLVSATTIAGVAHFIVHTLLLIYLVPMLSKDYEDKNPEMDYAEVAKKEANTWFSVNPVHCLRTKYIGKYKPHCRFSSVGKAHLLEVNTKLGCYFSDEKGDVADVTGGFSDLKKSVGEYLSGESK